MQALAQLPQAPTNVAVNAQLAQPAILGLSVSSGPVGTSVTITGANFGQIQGTSTVRFNGTTATVTSWSLGSIVTSVPAGATTGNVVVTVASQSSNGSAFTVTVPAPTVTITVPTASPTYDAGTSSSITVSGTASTTASITGCTWVNSLGGSGSATGTTSWSVSSLPLTVGSNGVTVTCTDSLSQTGNDVITITRSAGGGGVQNPMSSSRLPGGDTTLPNPTWAAAGATIPTGRTQCVTASCNTLAGGSVTATTIQNALGSAPADTYVQIPAGNFSIAGFTFNENNVTLRGAGSDSTKLTFNSTGVGGCGPGIPSSIRLCEGTVAIGCGLSCGASNDVPHIMTWSGTAAGAGLYPQGSTVVTLSAVTGLTVGHVIFLDQTSDTSDGFPAAGDIYNCETSAPCSGEGFGAGYFRSGRVQIEVHTVTACGTSVPGAACSITSVTIDPPLITPMFRTAKTPQAWWANASTILHDSGIENMTLDFSATGSMPGLVAVNVKNTWVQGIRLIKNATGSNIFLVLPLQAFRMTTRDSYFYGPTSSGTTQYVYTPWVSGSLLLENNIFQFNSSAMLPNDPESGSVYAYNYVDGSYYSQGAQTHNSGDLYNLYEGNNISGFHGEDIHGTHHFITLYRNHMDGLTHNGEGVSAGAAVALWAHNRFYNIVANVMGDSFWTHYSDVCTGPSTPSFCANTFGDPRNGIYLLGYKGNCGNCTGMATDTSVERTLLRACNWDYITSTNDNGLNDQTGIRNVAGEAPSGIANYPNPALADCLSLPTSLYKSAKPSWFGVTAWPPIGPDVTAQSDIATATGGHANRIPAMRCFQNATNDAAYGSSSPRIKAGVASACAVP